jgi:hypothetical protein
MVRAERVSASWNLFREHESPHLPDDNTHQLLISHYFQSTCDDGRLELSMYAVGMSDWQGQTPRNKLLYKACLSRLMIYNWTKSRLHDRNSCWFAGLLDQRRSIGGMTMVSVGQVLQKTSLVYYLAVDHSFIFKPAKIAFHADTNS